MTGLSRAESQYGRVRIRTRLTELLEIDLPIICAPMPMVSEVELTTAASLAGILGTFPALNYRSPRALRTAIRAVRDRTDRPFGLQLVVDRTNVLLEGQLRICVAEEVPVVLTGTGNPAGVIAAVQEYGGRVLCEASSLKAARRVADMGADAVVALVSGASSGTSTISPMALIPQLCRKLTVPLVCAGGVADGAGLAGALVLGADGVQMGTRFIASAECRVREEYKEALIDAEAGDVITTDRLSGRSQAVLKTPYTERLTKRPGPLERFLTTNRYTRRVAEAVLSARSLLLLGQSASRPTSRQVWRAGQAVELLDHVQPVARIVDNLILGYAEAIRALPVTERPASVVLH